MPENMPDNVTANDKSGINSQTELAFLSDNPLSIPDADGRSDEWKYYLIVLIAATLLYVPNAGSFGLWDCWETHYGEVARNMYETGDWLSPWWGYREKIGTEPIAGGEFFSKPILIFWAEALFMKLIGFGDWAVRLPMEIMGILTILLSYIVMRRIFNRLTGLISAFVLMTCPLFFFLARQAMTDMPFVSMLTISLLFFIHAYYSPPFRVSNKAFLLYFLSILLLLCLSAIPQHVMLALDLESESDFASLSGIERIWMIFQKNGIYHTIIYSMGTVIFFVSSAYPIYKKWKKDRQFDDAFKDRYLRKFSLWAFYIFIGFATLGKGLLGFMLPGAIIFFYILMASEWKALRRIEILRGLLCFALVALPWYLGMFAKHGNAFYTRFFVHDHFNRLGAGVHQIDSGTFDHFIKWLGYGIYPWIGFVPFVVAGIFYFRISDKSPQTRAKLFLYIWAFFAYVLFTLAATKFHHYIFPALPALALLIGIEIHAFLKKPAKFAVLAMLVSIGITLAVSLDLRSDVQTFRNMFTYKYDRPLPEHLPINDDDVVASDSKKIWSESTFYEFTNPGIRYFLNLTPFEYSNFTMGFTIFITAAMVLMLFLRTRIIGFIGMCGGMVVLTFWCLNYYMPLLSPHWSQKYLFEDYYKKCTLAKNTEDIEDAYTPIIKTMGFSGLFDYLGSTAKRVCKEDVISWLITWRGETYYTYNEIKPLMNANQLEPYLETINKGKPFFALMQSGRTSGLQSQLNSALDKMKKKAVPEFVKIKSWRVNKVHDENDYFILAHAVPVFEGEAEKEEAPEEKRPASPDEEKGAILPLNL
jgi:4-amino-4-deoxy-L-arabinose transferase-like glycosyltransferase